MSKHTLKWIVNESPCCALGELDTVNDRSWPAKAGGRHHGGRPKQAVSKNLKTNNQYFFFFFFVVLFIYIFIYKHHPSASFSHFSALPHSKFQKANH